MKEKSEMLELTISEMIYYAFFSLLLFVKGMGLYEGQWPFDVAIVISVFLICVKLIFDKNTVIEWGVILFLILLSALICINSNQIGIFMIMGTIIGMKNVPVKRVFIIGSCVWFVTFPTKMLISLLGLQEDIFRVQKKLGLGYVIRWSLGQSHPNVLQICCIISCMMLMYLFHFKGKKLLIATEVMAIANLYIFLYSISYTGIALVIFFLLINLYFINTEGRLFNQIEKVLIVLAIPLSAAFSILGPLYFPEKLWNICNKIFNTRFNITKQYIGMNPISLFGSGYCNELPVELNNLDSSYVFALMHYGIIFFVLMLGGLIALLIYLIKKNMKMEIGIILSLAVAAISEQFFANSSFKNIVWVFLGEYLFIVLSRYSKGDCVSKRIYVNINWLRLIYEKLFLVLSKYKKKIAMFSVIGGVICAFMFAMLVNMPSAYYMERRVVQTNMEHGFTIDINDLPTDFDGKFLQYVDEDTLMFSIDGNAVTLEYIRGIISMFVWCSLFIAILIMIIYYFKEYDRRKEFVV